MSHLEKFTEDQRDLLVRLPYRTGLWLSECDSGGGHDASEAELQALEAVVRSYAEDFCKSEFVEELMRETMMQKASWAGWGEGMDDMPSEYRRVMDLLAERLEEGHVTSFKHTLMEIATTVARAHREFDESKGWKEWLRVYLRYVRSYARAWIKKTPAPNFEDVLSISRVEEAVLRTLSDALRLDVEEGLAPEAV